MMDPIQDTMELMDAIQNKIDQASQLQTALYQIPVPASMPNGVRSDIDKVAESIDGAKRGLEGIKLRLQTRFNKLTAERRQDAQSQLKDIAGKGLRATGRLAGRGLSALGTRLSALEEEGGPRRLPTVTHYTGGQSKTYTYDPRLKQFRYLVYGRKPEYIEPGNPLYDELMAILKRRL